MTSLKKHIDNYTGDSQNATARAYYAALAAMGRYAEQAIPGVDYHLAANLLKLQAQLLADPAPAVADRAQQGVDSELGQWADSVERHLKSKAGDAREIMLAIAGVAQALADRDRRYAHRSREFTARLEEIASLDDISAIRRSLMSSASEFKAGVKDLENEGQNTIAGLEVKLEDYRRKIAEAERRERLDPLTGLVNRRGIEATIEVRRDARTTFCIVMLDLNSFKPVNDSCGHLAGDDLLKQFSAELRTHFRPADLIGRWGGDEFIVVVNGELTDANNCVERVRKWAFGTYKLLTTNGIRSVNLSAAVGVAVWDMQEEAISLIARADEAMYLDKRRG